MRSSQLGVRRSPPFARRFGNAGGQGLRRRGVAIVSALALTLPAVFAVGASSSVATAAGTPLYRINAGGPTLSDPGGDFIGVGRSNPTAPGVTLTNSASAADVSVTDTFDMSGVDPSLPMTLFQSLATYDRDGGQPDELDLRRAECFL